MILNFFSKIKFYLVRLIEKIPFIQIFIYNIISNFHFLFPHEKDYFGLRKIININSKRDFLDIGGNIGLSTIGFRQLGYNNRIFVFEPDKNYCVKKLKKLKKKISNIKIIETALSDKNEKKILYQAYFLGIKMHFLSSFDKKYLLNIINEVYKNFKIFFKIKTHKFYLKKYDDLKLKIKPIFVKIDVEGYDHKVIKGMLKTIKKYKPFILVEVNKENFNAIYEMLKNDYRPFQFIFKNNSFKKINRKEINRINKKFNRSFNFTIARNIFFIPKKN
tara:strand:+ start:2104 stop:2928 length:825 start_codon:yes stop_codon:yes gene_type:complete